MNRVWRSVLIEHIDGPVPIVRQGGPRGHPRPRAIADCICRGWIREGSPYSKQVRPKFTYLTDTGRMALAQALAAWAEALAAQEVDLTDRLAAAAQETPEAVE